MNLSGLHVMKTVWRWHSRLGRYAIIKQAKLEKGTKVTQAVSILLDDDKGK